MIDFETEIYNTIVTTLRPSYANAYFSSNYEPIPASFPCICIEQTDNYVSEDSIDSSNSEKFAQVMIEVNIFSAKINGGKGECKTLLNSVDIILASMGFQRTSVTSIPEVKPTTYRIVGRYAAKLSAGGDVYRR